MCCAAKTALILGFETPSVVRYKEGDRIFMVRLSEVPYDKRNEQEIARRLNEKFCNTRVRIRNQRLSIKSPSGWVVIDGAVRSAMETEEVVHTLEVRRDNREFRIYLH